METINLPRNSVLAVATLSILFVFPLIASAQSSPDPQYRNTSYDMNGDDKSMEMDNDIPRVRVTSQECSNLLSSGAHSLQQMANHREWRRKNSAQRIDLETWLATHNAFLAAQKEAQILHTQKTIACDKFRGQSDVITHRPIRVILFNPSSSSLPGRLTHTGTGDDEFNNNDTRTPQSFGITRASTRNAGNFYAGETDRPTKRFVQSQANKAEMHRRFLR